MVDRLLNAVFLNTRLLVEPTRDLNFGYRQVCRVLHTIERQIVRLRRETRGDRSRHLCDTGRVHM